MTLIHFLFTFVPCYLSFLYVVLSTFFHFSYIFTLHLSIVWNIFLIPDDALDWQHYGFLRF